MLLKVFSCPANLASHRRWHKPGANISAAGAGRKKTTTKKPNNNNNNNNVDNDDMDSTARGSLSPLSVSDDNAAAIDLSSPDTALKVSPESVKDQVRALVSLSNDESVPAEARPFECQTCGKAFRRRSYLRKHVAAVHPTQPLPALDVPDPLKSSSAPDSSPYSPDSDLQEPTRHVLQGGHSIQRLIQQRDDVVELERRDTAPVADPSASSSYLCKYCPDAFANLSTLTGHVNKDHSLDSRQVAVLTM